MSNKKGALLTEEQRLEKALTKKKRRKIALRIFIGFLVILALFVGITTLISVIGVQSNINKAHNYGSAGCAQLEYSVEDNGYVNIKSDKGLKVMQLTDVHIGGGWMSIKKGRYGYQYRSYNDSGRKAGLRGSHRRHFLPGAVPGRHFQ